jgi:hypothetical protein
MDMRKATRVLVLVAAVGGLCLFGMGCESGQKTGAGAEHPSTEHPKGEHPKGEHPKGEHPESEHPEHPQ